MSTTVADTSSSSSGGVLLECANQNFSFPDGNPSSRLPWSLLFRHPLPLTFLAARVVQDGQVFDEENAIVTRCKDGAGFCWTFAIDLTLATGFVTGNAELFASGNQDDGTLVEESCEVTLR